MDEEIRELLAYPEEIGRQVGFKDLTKLHREWMLNMIRGEGDSGAAGGEARIGANKCNHGSGTWPLCLHGRAAYLYPDGDRVFFAERNTSGDRMHSSGNA